jgi:hypothetical protein
LITIEQEYYAFIQRESVLFTLWLLLNLGTQILLVAKKILEGGKEGTFTRYVDFFLNF